MKNPYYRKPKSTAQSDISIQDNYLNFLDTVITQGYIFGLYNEGWALCATHTGQQSLAIWSHKNLASMLMHGDWANYKIQKVTLKLFLEKIIPYLKEVKYILSLNLSPEGRNIQVNPEKMLLDLKSTLYELYISRPDLYEKLALPLPRNIRIH
ncbi:DUF2750 domain-containing protein [Acinetobacter faecalis]|uniref:DUF2750 domain-containing protein n=1 Tax=Acinetobacter faecalis TaxID=2665161 RepID=UPI002A91E5C9|nr:DUF2750 domain-containing protein [Acinetobacter faecalis]MDY6456603.1 DUF2750 domain-containing protein [Acinetobacter faecalis]